MQCLLVRSNVILLASCTQKISLLPRIQAEKQVVELCSNHYKRRNFQSNSFLTQFAAHTISRRWVELVVYFFFRDYTLLIGVYYIQGAFRFAKPNRRYNLVNLVPILLQQSLDGQCTGKLHLPAGKRGQQQGA
jgi:hypothetical protein